MPCVAITFSGCVQMQQNLAVREKETKTRDDREERGLVPGVHAPEVAEEADAHGVLGVVRSADETTRHP